MNKYFLLLSAFLCSVIAVSAADLRISAPVNGKFQYTVDGKKFGGAMDAIQIFNGKNKHAKTNLKVVKSEVKNGVLTVDYSSADPAMEVKAVFTPDRKYLRTDIYVKNLSNDELHLLIHQIFPLPAGKLEYWNGSRAYKNVRRDMENKGLHGIFPLFAVYNKDYGIASGLSPEEIVNFMENGCSAKTAKNCFTGMRMVVSKGESNEISFVSFTFTPEYRYFNAVADYQEYKPEFFRPADNIDPRIHGTAETTANIFYYGGFGRRDPYFFNPEPARRQSGSLGSWAWGYAPFAGTGDWLIKPEQFKYPDDFNSPRAQKNDPFDYAKKRQVAIHNFRKADIAYMFYLITWADKKFAEKHFPECMLTDKRCTNVASNWVLSGGTDIRMLVYGNRFADMTLKDMTKIAETLDIAGFAYDCAGGVGWAVSPMPGVDKHPGRAYDDEGKVYVREAVGYALMMDHTHSLKNKDGYRLGVSGGIAGRMSIYFNTFRSDNCLTDATFSETFTAVDEQDVMRFMLGSKPHNFCVGLDHERHGNTLPWQSYTPQKIKEFYDSLRDMMMLFCFHRAFYYKVSENWGCEKFVYWQPIITETLNAGYQTVPAMRNTGKLWHSRYGKGLNTICYIGNQTKNEKKLSPQTDNKYIGSNDYLFAMMNGSILSNSVDKRLTTFPVTLKKRGIGLYRTVAEIAAGSKVNADASFSFDAVQGKAKVNFKTPYGGKITFRMPELSLPVEIKLNGQVIASNSTSATVPAGTTGEVEFSWKSTVFKVSEKELQEFPLVSFAEGKVSALPIVIPVNPAEFTRYAAERLAQYFPYYYRETENRRDINHEVRTTGKAPEKGVLMIDNAPKGTFEIRIDGNVLVLAADSPDALFKLNNMLSAVLDKKYWFYGTIGDMHSTLPGEKSTRAIRKKGGVGAGDKWSGIE